MPIVKKKELVIYIANKYEQKYLETISPIKLQMSLYFLFAFWGGTVRHAKENNSWLYGENFREFDEFLFDADFEAGEYGPVDLDVFEEHQRVSSGDVCWDNVFDGFLREFVEYLLARVFITNDFALVELAYEDEAWRDVYFRDIPCKKMDNTRIIEEYVSRDVFR